AVTRGYFQGMNHMMPTAISQVTEQFFNAMFSIILAYAFIDYGIIAAATGSTLGTGVGAIVGLFVLSIIYLINRKKIRHTKSSTSIYKNENGIIILKRILMTIIPIVLSTSIFSIMTNIDTMMLNYYLPSIIDQLVSLDMYNVIPVTGARYMDIRNIVDSLTGQYLGKYLTLINVPVSLILTIAMAAMPAISASMAKKDYKDIKGKIKIVLKIGFLFAVPSAVGLTIFAGPIMNLLYRNVSDGKELLIYGSVSILFIATAQLTTGILQGMGKQNVPTKHAFIACIIKVVCNFVLLKFPTLNIYAVVHSTTICYIVYAILNINYLKNTLKIKMNWSSLILKPIYAGILMGAGSWGLFSILNWFYKIPNIWLLIVICISTILYLIIGILIGAITKDDLETIPGGKKFIKKFL
ncbi:MAG: hypothetical protein ATN32_08725, partial [Candidatus Epulonipiscium fishelsonii]